MTICPRRLTSGSVGSIGSIGSICLDTLVDFGLSCRKPHAAPALTGDAHFNSTW